jgi:hypothetical protein
MKIVNSLWSYYVPYVKINPMVINYLDRYSSYATNMNNNLIANKSALIIVNNKNFPQEFNEEYQMRDKYYHLATDTNKFIINSSTINIVDMDPTNKSMYISKATIDGKTINYDGTSLYTTEDIEPYKFKPYYKETKYDNLNCYYKLVGAMSIVDGVINNDLVLPDYIITDNLTIIKTFNYANNKYFNENFYGINYNSRKLEISSTAINISSLTQLPFFFYLYKFTFSSDPFTANTKYLVSIDNQTGYLIQDGNGIITLLIGKNIIFNLGIIIKYLDASAYTNSSIFNYVNNNIPIQHTSTYLYVNFTLNSICTFNKYFTSGTALNNHIMFDTNNNLELQTYGYTINDILDKYFVYTDKSELNFYEVTDDTMYLPSINITKTSITYYSTYEEIIKNADNKDYWIYLKNKNNSYEYQIKNIPVSLTDGNYVVYFCNNTTQPTVYSHPDIYLFGSKLLGQLR